MDKPITFNEWLGTQGNMVLLHANCCRIAFEAGQQSQQAKVQELETKLKQAYEDVDTFAEAHERECGFKAQLAKDKAELQKRVGAAKQLIEDLNKCYQQDHQNKFEYWRGFADSAGILGKRLEQALKGGEDSE
ncbi:hypothetical protein Q4016_07215 [Acinetobacter baumannii]